MSKTLIKFIEVGPDIYLGNDINDRIYTGHIEVSIQFLNTGHVISGRVQSFIGPDEFELQEFEGEVELLNAMRLIEATLREQLTMYANDWSNHELEEHFKILGYQ